MILTRTHDAESEVLSVNDIKDHLRITGTDDDDSIRFFAAAIRRKTETYLGKTLVTSTWELKLDCFPEIIELLMTPIQYIASVSYIDTSGNNQIFTDIQFDTGGRLKPSYGNSWPSTREQFGAVTITYVAGHTHAGNVPEDIKLAMLLWIGDSDINREDSIIGTIISPIPNSAKDILNMYRDWHL